MRIDNKHRVYLIGIGGIGMSALARYFNSLGLKVAGYDRSRTTLCEELEKSGIEIHYTEDITLIPLEYLNLDEKHHTLIIYTPAVPSDHNELVWFRTQNFEISKRAEVLGEITKNTKAFAVAGTHGKTTISSCLAHLFTSSGIGCNAFLGGITKNYNTNFLSDKNSEITVVEADEYDRSFLQLSPDSAIITAVDADHLDIYENFEKVREAFNDFARCIRAGGKLLIKKESGFVPTDITAEVVTYSITTEAECFITNLQINSGKYVFNLNTPWGIIENIEPGVTGKFNVENVVAAASLCLWNEMDKDLIRSGLSTFKGVRRRFDLQETNNGHVFIDDYAHHPEELKAFISSVKEVYPERKIMGIFQPHLYSRTRDFAEGFGKSLSLLDTLLLLDIYPARELPIPGITSNTILDQVSISDKRVCTKEDVLRIVEDQRPGVLLTMGAGDIDEMVEPIFEIVKRF